MVTEVKLLPEADNSESKILTATVLQENSADKNIESENGNAAEYSEPQVQKKMTLTPIQQMLYDFIANIIQKYQVPYVPRLKKIYFLYKNTYGICFCSPRFLYGKKEMARRAWANLS